MSAKKHIPYMLSEKILLINLIKSHSIIDNKKTDAYTVKDKNTAWNILTAKYNSQPEVNVKREIVQLKKLWANIKHLKRKENTARRHCLLSTGGGSPSDFESDPILELVDTDSANIDFEFTNTYDSTAIFEEENNKENEVTVEYSNEPEIDESTANIPVLEVPHNETSQNQERSTSIKPKTGREKLKLEEMLRRQKLEEAIAQQAELHAIRVSAAKFELQVAEDNALRMKHEKEAALLMLERCRQNLP